MKDNFSLLISGVACVMSIVFLSSFFKAWFGLGEIYYNLFFYSVIAILVMMFTYSISGMKD